VRKAEQCIRISSFVAVLIILVGFVLAQLPSLPKIPKGITDKIPDLSKIVEGEPPITTSMDDAVTEVAFLDDFDPPVFMPMDLLPRTTNGAFVLERPGLYAFKVKSYCLKAGTYAPTGGNGYLLAPLKGPKSDIIRKLLHGTYTHPDVSQREIQVLIWAIIARTKISDMPRNRQLTAAKILSPKDILELNNGALGIIPEDMMDEAFEGVPPAVRSVLEAEARLRRKMTQGEASYEELEQVAVRFGAAPREEGDREIPSGRWSFHPDGYFIRFFPEGYTNNNIQIYVPHDCLIEKDARGRITAVCDRAAQRIEIEYDDNTQPLAVNSDPEVKAYAFKKVRFVARVTVPPEVSTQLIAVWENTGWTMTGIPSGKGKPSADTRFPSIIERYHKGTACIEEIERLDKNLKIHGDITDLMNLAHLKYAILDILENDRSGQYAWTRYHADVVSKAWQHEFSRRAGTFVWGQNTKNINLPKSKSDFWSRLIGFVIPVLRPWSLADAADNGKPILDNTGNASVPGNTPSQRGGNSNAGKANPCTQVKQALEFAKNVRQAYKNVDPSKYDNGKNYNKAVIKELNKILHKNGQASANPASQKNAPMGTHPTNCDLAPGGTSSNYKNSPDIIWRAERTHEQQHMNTCRQQTSGGNKNGYKDYMNDPENYQKDEVAAYDAQIAKLQAWFDWNCK
jgi:hypothetical protein